jgi:acylphosphatase
VREARRIRIRGEVQGVFFRETVRRIASRYDVHGFVRNVEADTVEIVAEAEPSILNEFIADVLAHPPPSAIVDDVESTAIAPAGALGFSVRHSA